MCLLKPKTQNSTGWHRLCGRLHPIKLPVSPDSVKSGDRHFVSDRAVHFRFFASYFSTFALSDQSNFGVRRIRTLYIFKLYRDFIHWRGSYLEKSKMFDGINFREPEHGQNLDFGGIPGHMTDVWTLIGRISYYVARESPKQSGRTKKCICFFAPGAVRRCALRHCGSAGRVTQWRP